eukprot:Plantae.Rhodophyta-Purpureofilum_apyrenoidigerum.ctg390.p1 GENE.Plantae.Rhodophyta-Purpureofilum_apyrenoidigerum.ctg390~~Plantae.Rhodophyta-Purpureofilum_apyrenoidigerum.ctg390.p1  ORF type:complete len:140 (+),score=7.99 Plantae.Rhodophyta-Purpureofilum_apyrenoidigerum.ctg390:3977-4396(+)
MYSRTPYAKGPLASRSFKGGASREGILPFEMRASPLPGLGRYERREQLEMKAQGEHSKRSEALSRLAKDREKRAEAAIQRSRIATRPGTLVCQVLRIVPQTLREARTAEAKASTSETTSSQLGVASAPFSSDDRGRSQD